MTKHITCIFDVMLFSLMSFEYIYFAGHHGVLPRVGPVRVVAAVGEAHAARHPQRLRTRLHRLRNGRGLPGMLIKMSERSRDYAA